MEHFTSQHEHRIVLYCFPAKNSLVTRHAEKPLALSLLYVFWYCDSALSQFEKNLSQLLCQAKDLLEGGDNCISGRWQSWGKWGRTNVTKLSLLLQSAQLTRRHKIGRFSQNGTFSGRGAGGLHNCSISQDASLALSGFCQNFNSFTEGEEQLPVKRALCPATLLECRWFIPPLNANTFKLCICWHNSKAYIGKSRCT